jgi:hypothetical protein
MLSRPQPIADVCSSDKHFSKIQRRVSHISALQGFYLLALAACVPGMTQPADVTCGTNRANLTLRDPGFTCNAGYYVANAPVYCGGTLFVVFVL